MTLPESTMNNALPLAGIRALEFCHTIMGPSAGLILADLGADVIKVEPADGDPTRRRIGFAAGFFATFNRNKRSFAVDLKNDDGRALLYRLAATADIVLENFAPGTWSGSVAVTTILRKRIRGWSIARSKASSAALMSTAPRSTR